MNPAGLNHPSAWLKTGELRRTVCGLALGSRLAAIENAMPTIIRFVMTLVVLAALVGAAMFYLANFVKPNIHEMTVRIPTSRLEPEPIAKPPPPAEAQPSDEVSGDAAPPE